ncbi:MAG TPA: 4Fe-4S dicluster domain-containing protein [Anaerolineales bacterium]|nr:4Fe-4S dicluster domain-containing protein [Anaerolineales bacterium]
MPTFGFVIDNRKCIGCHACSTACKSENEVPLGVNRTWVKYVETGLFPDTRRHFQVTRCNHCANPPCVRICPVTAMYQRGDGIVEFDPDICIGCKACMQACPYDAIYIDPNSGTAAKCHYCGHRTDIGLEPACVVVCPVHAIISGDMDNLASEISRTLASNRVTVRKPDQGTAPKLFYIEGNDVAMHPTAVERTPETFLWADVIPLHPSMRGKQGTQVDRNKGTQGKQVDRYTGIQRNTQSPITNHRSPNPQSLPWNGPIQIGGKMAEHMVQVSYNAQHKIPWHWPVPAYLVTKGIGAGIFMLLSLGYGLGWFPFEVRTFLAAGFVSLLMIVITTGLLVFDLEKPERFLSIVFRPQWRSWLARGAYLLIGFSALAGVWWLIELGTQIGWWGQLPAGARDAILWAGLPLAGGVAVYTAFLFGQAEGRDLWQSSLLPIHLLVQAFMVGSGVMLLVDAFIPTPAAFGQVVLISFAISLVVDILVTFLGEFGMSHASGDAAKAAHEIKHGHYKNYFWWGSLAVGHVLPLILLMFGQPFLSGLAAIAAIAGLYAFEYAFVMAPQEIPNS